jgi:hypothetical protein
MQNGLSTNPLNWIAVAHVPEVPSIFGIIIEKSGNGVKIHICDQHSLEVEVGGDPSCLRLLDGDLDGRRRLAKAVIGA